MEAFKSTLDEINGSDLILQVVDSTDENFIKQIDTVNEILEQIGADTISRVEVLTKLMHCKKMSWKHLESVFPTQCLLQQ